MKLELIIAQLRTYCPSFGGRVAGAADFAKVDEKTAVASPAAFVIPMDDSPEPSISQNAVRIPLDETFAVIVSLDNRSDERGQASAISVHAIRAEIWKALLGWQPEPRYNGIAYEGGNLMTIDRARLWWRFEFSAFMELAPSDGFEEGELTRLPPFEGANLRFEVAEPGAGQIVHDVPVPRTGSLP